MSDRQFNIIRKLFDPVKNTPLHPQWLSFRNHTLKQWLGTIKSGATVLDIGCFDRWPEAELRANCSYVGLDYLPKDEKRYNSQVDLFGDVQDLPLEANTLDAVLLFDVLEHIPNSGRALAEINRVLKPGGSVLIQIPFMYPIHDAPFDFRRPTIHGLEQLAHQNGFCIEASTAQGAPLETASLLMNIALASQTLSSMRSRYFPLVVLSLPLLVISFLGLNVGGWVASKLSSNRNLMPFSYQIKLTKR